MDRSTALRAWRVPVKALDAISCIGRLSTAQLNNPPWTKELHSSLLICFACIHTRELSSWRAGFCTVFCGWHNTNANTNADEYKTRPFRCAARLPHTVQCSATMTLSNPPLQADQTI